jgi:K+ transporter
VTISQGGLIGVSCGILIILFMGQSFGTERVSVFFSPIVVFWFT